MGYTHYFEMRKQRNASKYLVASIQEILNESKGLSFEEGDDRPPLVEEKEDGSLFIRFNGSQNGHETFWFDSGDTDFQFCKTARKEYDFYVCVVLLILKHVYGESLKLSSDGFSGWVEKEKKANPNFKVGSKVTYPDGTWKEALEYVKRLGIYFKPVCTKIRGEGKYYDWDLVTPRELTY